ncbi:hypothetical protein BG011_006081 [Mortierella polycephala]|uniref:F-box domain-containing protein n=1 Tax=Mortierella polycephala TaxID=41804 RepID=A0A9P6PWC6_9FUNG|nr:hypothetical protein BG011_006081 [Mortierella polycephala]
MPASFDIPELVGQLAAHLAPPDLLACIRVSQQWNQIFIPRLWHTVNDQSLSWSRILQTCTDASTDTDIQTKNERKEWVRHIFAKYGHHIRHLIAKWDIVVEAASVSGSCVNLKSLDLDVGKRIPCLGIAPGYQQDKTRCVENEDDALVTTIKNLGIESCPHGEAYQLILSQYVWRLTLANKGLHMFVLPSPTFKNTPEAKKFIYDALRGMKELKVLHAWNYRSIIEFWELLDAVPSIESIEGIYSTSPLFGPGYGGRQETLPKGSILIKSLWLKCDVRQEDLLTLFTLFPNLKSFVFRGNLVKSNNGDSVIASSLAHTNSINTLNTATRLGTDRLFRYLPNLTELVIQRLGNNIVDAILTHCKKIEIIRTQHQPWYIGGNHKVPLDPANRLFTLCPSLKVFDIIEHCVYADELIQQPWVCKGLEKFRCRIIGIERLSNDEQAVYNRVTAPGYAKDLSAYETAIVQKFERGREQQRQVYDRLASLTSLKELDLGYENRYPWEYDSGEWYAVDDREYVRYNGPTPNTMELSLESGLDRLAPLKDLKMFGFEAVDHRIRKKELEWMVDAWPKLRLMYGLAEDQLYRIEYDQKKAALREYMQTLRPEVVHGSLFKDIP